MKLKESETLSSSNKRVSNILKKSDIKETIVINEKLLKEPEEIQLNKILLSSEIEINKCLEKNDFVGALKNLVVLNVPINNFFEKVMVNTDEIKLKIIAIVYFISSDKT